MRGKLGVPDRSHLPEQALICMISQAKPLGTEKSNQSQHLMDVIVILNYFLLKMLIAYLLYNYIFIAQNITITHNRENFKSPVVSFHSHLSTIGSCPLCF